MRPSSIVSVSVVKNALDYARRGWRVVPIHYPANGGCSCGKPQCPAAGKHPRVADWAKAATLDTDVITKWYTRWPASNVGVAMGIASGIIDIETDTKHQGDKHLIELEMLLGDLPPTLSFKSGSGGTHRLYSTNGLPDGAKVLTVGQLGCALLGMPKGSKTGVDVRGEGGQAVFPPSLHASGRRYAWVNPGARLAPIPALWVPLLLGNTGAPNRLPARDAAESFLLNGPLALPDVDEALARSALKALSPDTTRLEWVTVGEAIRAQFGEEGLGLFIEWSSGELSDVTPTNYVGVEDVEANWATFGHETDRSKQVTFRSVLKLAREAGWSPIVSSVPVDARKALLDADAKLLDELQESIVECSTLEELHEWVAKTKKVELFDASKDLLRELVRDKWEEITKKTLGKADADKLMDDGREREEEARERAKDKGWANPYVFCAEGQSVFYNLTTRSDYSTRAFDQMYSSELISAVSRAQGKLHPFILPSSLLLNGDVIEKVYGPRYAPGLGVIFERDGERYVNTFVPGPTAVPREDWTDEDKEAVELWKQHINWLLDPSAATTILRFLAYVARNPGQRVRWCPLIYGPEGIGKSILGEMMTAVLGVGNLGVVSPAALAETKYNDWAEGTQMSVIEEIKADGASKWDIMRSLKEPLTNDRLMIHPKGGKVYQTINVTSYIAFTNSPSALALDDKDRRYYIASTIYRDGGFLQKLGGRQKAAAYFTKLVRALDGRGGVFRGWLEEIDLSEFEPSRAPDSAEKAAMVRESKSDTEVAVEDLISDGVYPTILPELIELEALKGALALSSNVSGQAVSRLLREMGFEPLGEGSPIAPPVPGRSEKYKSRWYVKGQKLGFDPHKSPFDTIQTVLSWAEFL